MLAIHVWIRGVRRLLSPIARHGLSFVINGGDCRDGRPFTRRDAEKMIGSRSIDSEIVAVPVGSIIKVLHTYIAAFSFGSTS